MKFPVTNESKDLALFITPVMPTLSGRGPGFRAYQWVQFLMKQYEYVTVMCSSIYGTYDPIPPELSNNSRIQIITNPQVTSLSRRFLNVITLKPNTYHTVYNYLEDFFTKLEFKQPNLILGFKITSLPVVRWFKKKYNNADTALDIDEVNSKRVLDIARLMRINGLFRSSYMLLPEIIGYKVLEKSALYELNCIIVSTQHEKKLFERVSTYRPCMVFENKIPVQQPANGKDNSPFQFLFVGNGIHYPNRDAIQTILHKILPVVKKRSVKDFKFVIVGGQPDKSLYEHIQRYAELEYLWDSDDLNSIYEKTDAALIPLRSGGGSSLKVLEALAHKKVVVSTKKGVRGFTLQHNIHCLISDDPDILAEYCIRLIRDRELTDKLAVNGYHWFLKNQSYKLSS